MMETVVKEAKTNPAARSLRNLPKRIGAKIIDADENFEAIVTRRLFEEELVDTADEASKAVAAVKEFARSRGLSLNVIGVDDLLEEYEDMVLGRTMDERMDEPSESMEDVMEFLRQR